MSSTQANPTEANTQKTDNGVDTIDCLATYTVTTTQEENQVISEVASVTASLPAAATIGKAGSLQSPGEDDISVSDGEGDVEVEHIGSSFDQKLLPLSPSIQVRDPHSLSPHYPKLAGKRTAISIWQKAILEQFYREGMTSASMHQMSVHQLAAEKTGLDMDVIKNWIRNRRRPGAAKTAEKIANLISSNNVAVSDFRSATIVPSVPHNPSVAVLTSAVVPHTMPSVQGSSPPVFTHESPGSMTPPLTKRPRSEQSAAIKHPLTSLSSPYPHLPHTPPGPSLPPQVAHNSLAASLPTHVTHISPALTLTDSQFLVKVRICGSADEDFIEVEVPSLTYPSLLAAICEELELSPSDVAKIRKLPNILVRKDKDVQRLRDGQELEIILCEHRPSEHSANMLPKSTLGVTVHSLPSGHLLNT